MTTHTIDSSARAGWPMFAALGTGTSIVLTAIGTFWDVNGNDTGKHDSIGQYLIVVGIAVVAAAVVFGLTARTPSPTKALVLGILSILTLVVFWSGLPPVLAAGSMAAALGSPNLNAAAKTGIALSAASVALAVVAAFLG